MLATRLGNCRVKSARSMSSGPGRGACSSSTCPNVTRSTVSTIRRAWRRPTPLWTRLVMASSDRAAIACEVWEVETTRAPSGCASRAWSSPAAKPASQPAQGCSGVGGARPGRPWARISSAMAVSSAAITGMSITTAAGFVPGETVLVQGATGVAGRPAVKIARLLGAGRIVATGRDAGKLEEGRALGADAVISTAVSDEDLARPYRNARGDGYDVVADFLWGRPTQILLGTLIPDGFGF